MATNSFSSHKDELSSHINIIYEVEKIATTISKLKSKGIAFDKQRQKNTEALRAIRNCSENPDDIDNDSIWLDCNGTMVRFELDIAKKYLTELQIKIDKDIKSNTQELKRLVADLQLIAPSKGIDPASLSLILKD